MCTVHVAGAVNVHCLLLQVAPGCCRQGPCKLCLHELVPLQVADGELDLQPSYQRGLVWDKKMASRLVVTALEQRLLPAVFLEEGGCHAKHCLPGHFIGSLLPLYHNAAVLWSVHYWGHGVQQAGDSERMSEH